MLTERIIGAFTFRKGVYADVEQDTSFTTTAWMIVATALVFLMTPGLAFFYGGMVNKKSVI